MDQQHDGSSIGCVLRSLVRHPVRHFLKRWNWKSAILSSLIRSGLFFAANLGAGLHAARSAFLTELIFRSTTAGFYGALTQALRSVRPARTGTLASLVLLPLCAHGLEFAVHYVRGTERLALSLVISIAFTVVSTAFNLFAMRRGVLIVGEGCGSLWADLRRVPRLIAEFAAGIVRGLLHFA